ncbi:uncharacterized protein N7511_007695 [Penicillium nucicola]|uniref:uncharacterized protein n=1 Tax=Penicillium nucicola TaxID=1850975 RepID=UPI00254554A1|nr:uncharacterized protein N7511_007695 [Penicillium nucicola]KAJ5753542.1 hypothetical protein N7511_007695 [Penicillium nucicola]
MRYSFTITALSLISSACAITITAPASGASWDFSTAKTIKFTSGSGDPSVVSIILKSQDGSFQTKLADNVKTSEGEYTTQPNPSISNGNDYEIQIIDSSGQLAVSDSFTVKKGASDDGTTSSPSSTSSSTSTSIITTTTTTTTTTTSSSTSSSTTSSATTTPSVTSTLTTSASSTSASSTNSTTTSVARSSSSSGSSSTSASASPVHSTGAAPSHLSAPKGAMALLGAACALFYV